MNLPYLLSRLRAVATSTPRLDFSRPTASDLSHLSQNLAQEAIEALETLQRERDEAYERAARLCDEAANALRMNARGEQLTEGKLQAAALAGRIRSLQEQEPQQWFCFDCRGKGTMTDGTVCMRCGGHGSYTRTVRKVLLKGGPAA